MKCCSEANFSSSSFTYISWKTKKNRRPWVDGHLQNSHAMATHSGQTEEVPFADGHWLPQASWPLRVQQTLDDAFSESSFSAPLKQGLLRKVKDWMLSREEGLEVTVRTQDVTSHQTPDAQRRQGKGQQLRKLGSLRPAGSWETSLNSSRVDV